MYCGFLDKEQQQISSKTIRAERKQSRSQAAEADTFEVMNARQKRTNEK